MEIIAETEPIPIKMDEHGVARVGGTRVTLQTLIGFYLQGESAEELARGFPSVKIEDIYATLSYFHRHRAEVERYLEEQERWAAGTRREMEKLFPPGGLRERLLARRNEET